MKNSILVLIEIGLPQDVFHGRLNASQLAFHVRQVLIHVRFFFRVRRILNFGNFLAGFHPKGERDGFLTRSVRRADANIGGTSYFIFVIELAFSFVNEFAQGFQFLSDGCHV